MALSEHYASVGSTNGLHNSVELTNKDNTDTVGDDSIDCEKTIESWGRRYAGDGRDRRKRQESVNNINWGMTILANGIKVVSAIITILAVDDTDRSDSYDDAVYTLLKIGASVLKLSANYILDTYSSKTTIPTNGVNKIGEAAQIEEKQAEEKLSPEELLKQQQVLEFVSKLSAEQIKLQQSIVEEHVTKEAGEKNLNEAQTALLLAQTLEHNGLPQLSVAPSKIGYAGDISNSDESVLDNVMTGVNSVFNTVLGGGENLPKPGTLSHSLTMGLLKAQQTANKIANVMSDPSYALSNIGAVASNLISGQPPAEDKIGEAHLPAHVTYSEVKTGLDPTYTALGVLTTGALGSMLYSSGIASSATALARGAVEAVKRNDLVTTATNALTSVLGDDLAEKIDQDYTSYDYYEYDGHSSYYDAAHPYYHEVDFRHLPYDEESYQTKFTVSQPNIIPISELDSVNDNHIKYVKTEHVLKNIKPVYVAEASEREVSEEDMNTGENAPETVKVNFFKPEQKVPSVPYIPYNDQHNPWDIIQTGQDTDHLYH
jgi:hypothetical protein